jgi:hypothetical protein
MIEILVNTKDETHHSFVNRIEEYQVEIEDDSGFEPYVSLEKSYTDFFSPDDMISWDDIYQIITHPISKVNNINLYPNEQSILLIKTKDGNFIYDAGFILTDQEKLVDYCINLE